MGMFFFDAENQKKVSREALSFIMHALLQVLRQAQGERQLKEKLENLLLGLMTPKEIEEFAERIRIVQLLKKGVSQHDIAGKLGVGVATVSRGAKEIKQGNFKYV